jgi:hypothetical protein
LQKYPHKTFPILEGKKCRLVIFSKEKNSEGKEKGERKCEPLPSLFLKGERVGEKSRRKFMLFVWN